MGRMKTIALLLGYVSIAHVFGGNVEFDLRSVKSGNWSEASTWGGTIPAAGQRIQVRPGHQVIYDVQSDTPIRLVHVAGTLQFSQEKSTKLVVGLLKAEPGEETTEDGFNCHAAAPTKKFAGGEPAIEMGTAEHPVPVGITTTVQLKYFEGMNAETLPAIVACGGRWDVHGAPMNRTWVKLGAATEAGATQLTLAENVTGWKVGDRIIVTSSSQNDMASFRPTSKHPTPSNTEVRTITGIEGTVLKLDAPLEKIHYGGASGILRCEVANLSRNVVIESAEPNGVRGHTMYHCDSAGGISYAEFRHLGKEGVLGKYSIHFHLVGDTMRGSGVVGASIWDSHNRWVTIHGSDHLLVRDCVGYQSVGHGFFLEDGTEQYNVLDRNLAVQAFGGKPLPKQALAFDHNEGAGFWWANGRNTLTRNVSCENDRYGYRFEIARDSRTDYSMLLRGPATGEAKTDIRSLPFFKFEDNESHSEGLYSFNFGDDHNGFVHGDRKHPFVAKNLRAWETHYVLRPNLSFFLMDQLTVKNAVYGVYHPDYDAHVYRDVELDNVNSEPINRGHDDESIQYGDFTFDRLTLRNCKIGRDPLIQLACTAPHSGVSGHFRDLKIEGCRSRVGQVVDLGGGPRNDKLDHAVSYFFHEAEGTKPVVSAKFPDVLKEAEFVTVPNFTGPEVRAANVANVAFPTLLEPTDDVPPATLVTSVSNTSGKWKLRGVSHDNGTVASVTVNGAKATILSQASGVADWEITLSESPKSAHATDAAGNVESWAQKWEPGS